MGVREYVESRLSKKELLEAKEEADLMIAGIEALRSSLSTELNKIMKSESIGFRELGRRLGITDTMTAKLLNGGNVNFDTISKLSKLNGKVPVIVWKDPKNIKRKAG